MSLKDTVEDIIIATLEKSRHPAVDCAYDDLSRDRFTNNDMDDILNEVLDIVEEADIDERRRDGENKIAAITVMVVAKWADEEGLTDRLDDRDFRKVETAKEDYDELIERLEGGSRRGRGRDRDSGRGRSNRRRGRDDFSASDRDGRSGRSSRDRDDNRGGGRRRKSSRNKSSENAPLTMVQRRAEQNRELQAQEEEQDMPQTPQAVSRAERNRPVRQERTERNEPRQERSRDKSYDFVGEKEVASPPKDLTGAEEELGFLYEEVPTGTIDDYIELGINIEDPKFIMTRAIDKTDTYREVIYDPFAKQPVWKLNENGMRVLRFRDFSMNIDNHVIPDFKRTSSVPSRVVNREILPSLAQPTRRSILDISKKADELERQHEDRLNEWEAQNKDLPTEDKDIKPESPALQKLGSHTLRVDGAIDANSLGEMIQETMSNFGQLRGFTEGHPPVESFGSIRQFAWCAQNPEERDDIISKIEMFTTAHSHTSEDRRNVVPIHHYHAALMAVVDTIPFGLWKRINRNMTEYCNDILTVSLGLTVTIDDFAEDGDKIIQYLVDHYGNAVMEGFIIGHAQCGGRISMLEPGKGNDVLIYEVKGTQVTILPATPEELTISSVKLDDKDSSSLLVTGDSNLRLFNALRTISTQSTPLMGKQTPYKYIVFSDGSVYKIDRNAIGLSGENKREVAEFLLTQVEYR